jgi:plastocyanin
MKIGGGVRGVSLYIASLVLISVGCEDNEPIFGVGGGTSPADAEVIEIVGGDAQHGRTLEVLPRPLAVKTTDARGTSVSGVTVLWELVSGLGTLSAVETPSDARGRAEVLFTPGPVLGDARVRATIAGEGGPSVEFTLSTSVFLVSIVFDGFRGPLGGDSLQVVIGDTIEWVNRDVVKHAVVATVVPDSGFGFQSLDLANSERFRFVPKAAGLYEYVDPLNQSAQPPTGKIAVAGLDVGSLKVVTATTGTAIDPLFAVTVDGSRSAAVGPNDSVVFLALAPVGHSVRLVEVNPNCAVAGENPRLVIVAAGDTVSTTFDVVCQ